VAFDRLSARTPTSIPIVSIILTDTADGENVSQGGKYDLLVQFSDGTRERRSGNLVPHLTSQQVSTIQSFLAAIRTKAKQEMLP